MKKLDGQVIAVTGASGNLGLATARAVIAHGAIAVLLDRHHGAAHTELEATGRAFGYELDLADEAAVTHALAEGKARAGRLDGIVCTVGGYKGGVTVADGSWSDWSAMLDVNVKTTVACSRAILPHLVEQGRGSIVHVASLAALAGSSGQVAYSAAKAAVLRLTEGLADEVKARGVRVNAVLPGTIDTPQNRAWMSKEQADLAIDPAAIAETIAFLLSEEARAVNGAAIKITGRQ